MGYNAPTNTYETFTDLRLAIGQASSSVKVLGAATVNDEKGGDFYWDDTSTLPDDSMNIIRPLSIPIGRWIRSKGNLAQITWGTDNNITDQVIAVTGNSNLSSIANAITLVNNGTYSGIRKIVDDDFNGSVFIGTSDIKISLEVTPEQLTLQPQTSLNAALVVNGRIQSEEATNSNDVVVLSQLSSAITGNDLQQVTTNGNSTTNSIAVTGNANLPINPALTLEKQGNIGYVNYRNGLAGIASNLQLGINTWAIAGTDTDNQLTSTGNILGYSGTITAQPATNSGELATLGQVQSIAVPAGSNQQVQFNNSGAFGASSGLTFNSGTNHLNVTGTATASPAIVSSELATLGQVQSEISGGRIIVDTYADMLPLVTGTKPLDFLVLNDENKGQQNTTYNFYPSNTTPTLMWVASIKEEI